MSSATTLQIGSKEDFILKIKCQQQSFIFEGPAEHFVGYRLGDETSDDGAFVRWSCTAGQFKLTTDRLGLYPVYYHQTGNELFISNSLSLLQQNLTLELDIEAVGLFLRLGFYLGSDTAFKSLVRPQGKLSVSADLSGFKINVTRPVIVNSDVKHTPEQYQELMLQALASVRGGEQPLYMPLTGGKDSRHIFLSLMQLNIKPDSCYTVSVLAPHYNDDVVIAKRLAGLFAVPHQTLAADKHLIQSEYAKNVRTNFETRDHSWAAPACEYLNQAPAGVVLDGFGGDVLSQSSIVTRKMHQLYLDANWTPLLQLIAKDNTYFNAWLNQAAEQFIIDEDVLAARLTAELQKFQGETNPLAQFYFWNRSRRSIAISSIRYLSGQSTAFMPFMQQQLYDFLCTLPVELYFSGQFHSALINELSATTNALPYSTSTIKGHKPSFKDWLAIVKDLAVDIIFNDHITLSKKVIKVLSLGFDWRRRSDAISFFHFYRRLLYLKHISSRKLS